ncbi:MAG: hypothetical protein IID44_18735 [Planctomycetes bacterium]|nr:hypothetical protein [Planctomycetota bacterium]
MAILIDNDEVHIGVARLISKEKPIHQFVRIAVCALRPLFTECVVLFLRTIRTDLDLCSDFPFELFD